MMMSDEIIGKSKAVSACLVNSKFYLTGLVDDDNDG